MISSIVFSYLSNVCRACQQSKELTGEIDEKYVLDHMVSCLGGYEALTAMIMEEAFNKESEAEVIEEAVVRLEGSEDKQVLEKIRDTDQRSPKKSARSSVLASEGDTHFKARCVLKPACCACRLCGLPTAMFRVNCILEAHAYTSRHDSF